MTESPRQPATGPEGDASAASHADRLQRVGCLLRPRSVAVIGASSRRATLGNQVLKNLTRWPFAGDVFVVHPTAGTIEGRPALPRVGDLPAGLDVAVVCLPAPAVAEVLLALDERGCRSAIVVAAGLQGEPARALRRVVSRIALAVCGPNNMGVINASDAIALYTARFREPLPVGPVALITQSGSGAIALVNTPGLAFSKIITSGNEWGLGSPDYLRWLAHDPQTEAAGIVLEAVHSGPEFAAGANEFIRAGKRLVVLKVGRSPAGSAAAAAHTGAIIGAGAAYEAFFRREGIPVVRDYDEMAAALQCLGLRGMPAPRGRRLAIVAISGGEGALAADIAAEQGMPLAAFADATRDELAAALPGGEPGNPLDLHASPTTAPDAQERAVRAVAADPGVDMVLALQDAQHSLPIHDAHDYVHHLEMVRRAVGGAGKPVVVASTTSTDAHARLEQVLAGSPIPILRGVREAVAACDTLATAARAAAARGAPATPAGAGPYRRGAGERDARRRELIAAGPGPLPEGSARELLAAYGIPLVRRLVVRDGRQAVEAAREIAYPLVVKVVSRQVAHRSDVGGVVTGVGDDAQLLRACERIARRVAEARPDAEIEGYELQPMLTDAVEAMVGFQADPAFGGIVTVGLGGVLVELLGGHAAAIAPVETDEAAAMIRRTPLHRLLAGYRGLLPPTAPEPLARVVQALSALGADLAGLVAAVDLNPVLVRHGSGEAVAVDALVIAGPGPTRGGAP